MAMQISAPFSDEQVENLNKWQKGPWHSFTCGTVGCRETIRIKYKQSGVIKEGESEFEVSTTLIATKEGWVCPKCDYRQYWAWDFMAEPQLMKVVAK